MSSRRDEEASELAKRLDREFDEFLQKLIEKSKKKAEAEKDEEKTIDEIAEELSQHPAFLREIDPSKPLHPAVEALQALKYESEDPTAGAESYKEEGNYLFRRKDYRTAVGNYTEGIKLKSPDCQLNAALYSNRATAQYNLGNYRSSLNDCIYARKFKPDSIKAIFRGTLCCMEMNKYAEAIHWSEAGLLLKPQDEKFKELKAKSEKQKKLQDRDLRKEQAKERKEQAEEDKLFEAIQKRGIHLVSIEKTEETAHLSPLMLTSIECHNPTGAKVHLDLEGVLYWPVLFMYPEFTLTDFIESFSENSRFIDHVYQMFGPDVEPAPFDTERKYIPEKIEIYFQEHGKEILHQVRLTLTLGQVLGHKRYSVFGGTPCFILMVGKSRFKEAFMKSYCMAHQ